MRKLFSYINRVLCICAVLFASVAYGQGTIDIGTTYGVSWMTDATLSELGYTYAKAKAEFPRWTEACEAAGWSQSEVLGQYKITSAINDAQWTNDTYIGQGAFYGRPGQVTQSRTKIILPHGTYRESGSAIAALGTMQGQGSNCWGQSFANQQAPKGSTPGTMFVVDHAKWNKVRYPERILMRTSTWGQDYGIVGGIAYSEGTIIEGIRFDGGWADKAADPSFYSAGLALGDLGECSTVRNCFAFGFNGDGIAGMSGTPGMFLSCSSFNNKRFGFAVLCTSGLHANAFIGCSGDDNGISLYGNRAWTGGVSGGTITIEASKAEGRKTGQYLGDFEGQVNVTITGAWTNVDVSNGPPAAQLIKIDPKGKQWQVDARGILHGSNVGALLYNVATGQYLESAGAYRAQSFAANNDGLFNATRPGIKFRGSVVTPPVDPGPVTPPPTTGSFLSRTGWTATAFKADGTNTAPKALDGNTGTFYHSGASQTSNGNQWLTVDMKASKVTTGINLTIPAMYPNDWPTGILVQVSTNNTNWTEVARGPGAVTTTLRWAATNARYIRVTPTVGKGPWWAVAELNIYGQ